MCIHRETNTARVEMQTNSPESVTSSRMSRGFPSSMAAQIALMETDAEVKRAIARLADTKAECNEQNSYDRAMIPEIGTVQNHVKSSIQSSSNSQTAQTAKMEAMRQRCPNRRSKDTCR